MEGKKMMVEEMNHRKEGKRWLREAPKVFLIVLVTGIISIVVTVGTPVFWFFKHALGTQISTLPDFDIWFGSVMFIICWVTFTSLCIWIKYIHLKN